MDYKADVGLVPASWEKIASFAQAVDRGWEWWELRCLYLMASAYTQAYKEGEEPLAIPPSDQPEWVLGKTFQFQILPAA